jgi:tRNA (guanine-N7-)-methyltransferase
MTFFNTAFAYLCHMGRKNKLERFAEVATFPNVIEVIPGETTFLSAGDESGIMLKGAWAASHFQNNHPIILELACGKGDYTLALASDRPDQNFIGVDIKGSRIWRGAKTALESSRRNVAFLRTRIEFIERFFAPGEVSEIWITFPDPFEGKITRRLTSAPFIERYRKILKPDGIIHLKTDSRMLYDFTLDVIHSDARCNVLYANPDIYNENLKFPELDHKTYYEKKHLADGKTIKYLRFKI